jgi:Protein of unknown function (DUF3093)
MASARTTPAPRFKERLGTPWWWWPIGLGLAALGAAEIGLGAPGPRGWVPFAIVLPLVAATLAWSLALRVRVTDDEFQVADARLPLRFVREVVAIDAAGRRELLGPAGDPLAFLVMRPWIGTAVQVVLDDPEDPTPYWLVSTRKPIELAQALRGAALRGAATAGRPRHEPADQSGS